VFTKAIAIGHAYRATAVVKEKNHLRDDKEGEYRYPAQGAPGLEQEGGELVQQYDYSKDI